jgi:3-deoxy-D-manno-octulosonic-acid transferase
MRFLYSAALALFAALAWPYFLVQGLRHGKYLRNFRARWGRLPDGLPAGGVIWLHAVSMGEVLACPRLVKELKRRMPERRIVVSTITETGFQTAQKRLAADGFFYCPFDFAFVVRRVLRQLRPALLVVVETELWPNLFYEARRGGVRLVVVNARISDRSFPRYRLFRTFFGQVLACADALLAQSDEDARRLRGIGAPAERISVTGTLKYDLEEPARLPDWLDALLERWSAPGVLIAGSTAAGEEESVLDAFQLLRKRRASLRLMIAPRRPERFDEVTRMAQARGLSVQRRSQLAPGAELQADTVVLDSVGELAAAYRHAAVVLVGGSLVSHGGQNPLEPAFHSRPMVAGPSMSNFREITEALRAAGGILQIRSADELASQLERLFSDPVASREMGRRARALLDASRGATDRTVHALEALLAAREAPQEVAW